MRWETTMPETRPIKLKRFLDDVRTGMTRAELMDKYCVTSRQLQRALMKLLELKAITLREVPERLPTQYATVAQENIRDLRRHPLDFPLPVYDANYPQVVGSMYDVSLEGAGLTGLATRVGDISTIVALGDDIGAVGPFEFLGQCRWIERDDSRGSHRAGFQILSISPADREELHRLVHITALGD
jgi:hypothetical protein